MQMDSNRRATTVKKHGRYRNQCRRQLKRQKEQTEVTQNSFGKKNNGANNSMPKKRQERQKKCNRPKRPKNVYPHCGTCQKTSHSTKKCYFGANTANQPPAWNKRAEG